MTRDEIRSWLIQLANQLNTEEHISVANIPSVKGVIVDAILKVVVEIYHKTPQ